MSRFGEKIKEVEKKSKRTRLITTVLATITLIFIAISVFLFLELLKGKQELAESNLELVQTNKELDDKNKELDEANLELESLKTDLENIIKEKQQQELERQKANDDIWNYAKSQNTIEAYLNYLEIKPDATNKEEVFQSIDDLMTRDGFVQIKETNGNMIFKPSDYEGYFTPESARSVRYGVIGNPDYQPAGRNGDVVLAGQLVRIVDTIEAGPTARWGKIKYSRE